jgi:hypothetical protein
MGKEKKEFPVSDVSIGLLLGQMMVSTWNFLKLSYRDSMLSDFCRSQEGSLHFVYLRPEKMPVIPKPFILPTKSASMHFKSQNARYQRDTRIKTHNNSLIDCHAEVWTRYPVWSPIRHETPPGSQRHRRGITFISSHRPDAFKPYFDAMIRDFERTTRNQQIVS